MNASITDGSLEPNEAKLRRTALSRWDNEGGAPDDRSSHASIVVRPLPAVVRETALRLGAGKGASSSTVTMDWSGTMKMKPGGRAMRFSAHQTIALAKSEFDWRARFGPFGCVSVVDAMTSGRGVLDARLFGLFSLAHAEGPATDKGEIMRYLAELAWAPDAILANNGLDWTVVNGRTFRVAAGVGTARGSVEFHLDENGDIASIRADDRPAMEGRDVVERPWIGRFSDYRVHCGRRLPFVGEVAWVLNGREFVYWRGNLLSWSVD